MNAVKERFNRQANELEEKLSTKRKNLLKILNNKIIKFILGLPSDLLPLVYQPV